VTTPAPGLDATGKPLGRVLARGIMWVGIFRWSAQVISWACTLIVIRLLLPADYGIVGMTTYFIGLAGVFSEFGIGSAVIVSPSLSTTQIRQLHAFSILLGASGSALSLAAALPVSRYFGEPALITVLPVLGLMFLIDGFRTVPLALMSKALDYRRAASSDFVRAIASAAVVLTLAVLGAGYWALVGGILAGSLAATLWVTVQRPTGFAWPRLSGLAEPIRYCRHLLVGRLAWQGYQNADFVVAGRMFGVAVLGTYNVAWTIASLPGEKLTTVVIAAVSPFFASLRDRPEALRHYMLRILSLLSLVLFPPLFGFLLVADLAIPVVLGSQWAGAISPARALVFYAVLQSVSVTLVTFLSSTGKTGIAMRTALLNLLILPVAFVIGGRLGGITGIALAWAAAYPFLVAMPLRATLQTLNIRLRTFLATFRHALLTVAVMSVCVLGFRRLVQGSFPPQAELWLSVIVGAVAAVLTVVLAARDQLDAVRAMLRREAPPGISGVTA